MSSSRDDFGIAIRSALLKKGARQKFSLVFLLILATIIFLLDTYQFKFIKFTKILINDGIYRITNISTAPIKLLPKINDKIVLEKSIEKNLPKIHVGLIFGIMWPPKILFVWKFGYENEN